MNDKQFMTTFLGVMGVIAIIFFVIFFIAQIIVPSTKVADEFTKNNLVKRIEPIGQLNYSGEEERETSQAKIVKANLYSNGQEVYNAVCQSCHTSGILNSPKYGDTAEWQQRMNKGKEKLYTNAINGIGAMPAKGGRPDLSNKMIEMGVDYILESLK